MFPSRWTSSNPEEFIRYRPRTTAKKAIVQLNVIFFFNVFDAIKYTKTGITEHARQTSAIEV
ncbi:MAG: hypothetical protein U9O53_02860 [archaeon]|nr:hypothetical protein [archaeon]